MGELIEHDDSGSTSLVSVGTSDAPVSLKVYQDIYHQVTGRTEQIRKRYKDNLRIDMSQLQQLHYKIMQLCDVHTIVAQNETVSVFHSKERKEQFTSFERFKAYNSSTSSPTVNLVLKYNFSIIPAGIRRPQEYVVTIKLSSRIAMLEEFAAEAPPFMRGRILGFVAGNVAEITVEYSDYVVARGFTEAFDEWVNGCDAEPDSRFLRFSQRWSHFIPKALQLIVGVCVGFYAINEVPNSVIEPIDMQILARFFIIFSVGFFVLTRLAMVAGRLIEEAIDSYSIISYLKLNNGDNKLIESFSKNRNKVCLKFILGSVVTIVLGIISSKLAIII
ncbi:hypothetical protein [Plesiomonas shigelloides]|uniref:hypothetical protein n=1 Tax=Plesiomonas shigelloides TaxID=703 RepID=UPI0012624C54|nr:hypothetical protein [Plesiomonas shigelloides]KAB7702896.1 hypothetical protein GBN15_00010 [Plesiomonas shigelloides]